MKNTYKLSAVLFTFFMSWQDVRPQSITANHLCTDISQIPVRWIDSAKNVLHIAYGHTSHGSQITDGMSGLVDFANGGGKGLSLPNNIFAWNNGGTSGALDLHDYAMGGDAGYYPDWVNNTREYLNDVAHIDVNVIMWSWCGQVSGKYSGGTLYSEYLGPMNQLEQDYPDVKFIYMTGHLDHGDDVNNKAANDSIRRYCQREGKILFDFADIESYNPDGVAFPYADDACNYYSSREDYESDGNWAQEWRALHAENIDWYNCSSAHSDPLNANQKAYAAWWLWAKLAGWSGTTGVEKKIKDIPETFTLSQNYPNPFNPTTTIEFTLSQNSKVSLKIYDILGREVASLLNGEFNAGKVYQVKFDASRFPSGIYFYRLEAGESSLVQKMILMK